MSNTVSATLGTTPGEHRDVVWVPNPNHFEYDPAISEITAWCQAHGLDASRIPHPDGIVICLDSPDGGLAAYVTEIVGTDTLSRNPDGTLRRTPVRKVQVDAIPKSGGIVSEWAARMLGEVAS